MSLYVRWVKQEHNGGCGIAALAMLTGQSYQQVAADFSHSLEDGFVHDLDRASPNMQNMDRYLAERGFAICRLFLRNLFGPRTMWPPEPWANQHLCHVKILQSSRQMHWVVMLGDGSVLDPNIPEPKRLTDYYQVLNVAAVIPLSKCPP